MLTVGKMINRKIYLLITTLLIAVGFSTNVFAEIGLGTVAQNVMEPVTLLSDMIDIACFVIGGAFLFATIIKYVEHRRSPLMVPISTVIFLFLAGLILVCLPFLAYFVEGGVPFTFLK